MGKGSVLPRVPRGAEIALRGADCPVADEVLTVVTWNVHFGCGPTPDGARFATRAQVAAWLDAVAEALRSWTPDVVALQEVDRGALRSCDTDQLLWLARATGLSHAAWTATWEAPWVPYPGPDPRRHIGRVRSGQAILSRFPLRDPVRHDLPQPPRNGALYNTFYLHRALLDATADLGAGRALRVVCAHLEAFDVQNKEDHARRTTDHLSGTSGTTPLTLLLGDMNAVPPEAALRKGFPDEPETDMTSDRTIPTLRAIPGLTDAAPASTPEAEGFTFPAHLPNRRLDYLFHGRGLDCTSAFVPRLMPPPSDHLPVVARFRLKRSDSLEPAPSPHSPLPEAIASARARKFLNRG